MAKTEAEENTSTIFLVEQEAVEATEEVATEECMR